jgi:hypothetical protein
MGNHGGIISTGKLIRPPEFTAKPTSSHLVAKQGGTGEGNEISPQKSPSIFGGFSYHVVKSYNIEPTALLPIRRKACSGLLLLLKTIAFGRV